ncbi:MAG: protein kinase [Pirellulaceae bacterium]
MISNRQTMLTRDGTVKILDLGLAYFGDNHGHRSERTNAGQVMGTFDYLAPEQATGAKNVDVRADIYSLGCTLFKLLTGRAPYAKHLSLTLRDRIHAHRDLPIPSASRFRADIPLELDALLAAALFKHQATDRKRRTNWKRQLATFCVGHDLLALIVKCEERVTSDSYVDRQKRSDSEFLRQQSTTRMTAPMNCDAGVGWYGKTLDTPEASTSGKPQDRCPEQCGGVATSPLQSVGSMLFQC